MSEYKIIVSERVEDNDVEIGDVVYIPTESGSSYILDVTCTFDGVLSGTLSRRGSKAILTDDGVTGDFDDIRGNVLCGDDNLQVGRPAIAYYEGLNRLITTQVVDGLQIIRDCSS